MTADRIVWEFQTRRFRVCARWDADERETYVDLRMADGWNWLHLGQEATVGSDEDGPVMDDVRGLTRSLISQARGTLNNIPRVRP